MGESKKRKRLLTRNGGASQVSEDWSSPIPPVMSEKPSSFSEYEPLLENDPRFIPMSYELKILALKRGFTLDELMRWIHRRYGVRSMKKLTLGQYKELKVILRSLPKLIQ